MDKFFEEQLLYDYYGDLLTENQRKIMHLYYEENLGLAEIAKELDTSRQNVYDTVQRALKSLRKKEIKLGLVKRESIQTEILTKAIEGIECCLDDPGLELSNRKKLQQSRDLLKELLD